MANKHKKIPIPEHARIAYHGDRYKVHTWEQEMFDGTKKIFEKISRKDSVGIIPVLGDKILVSMERQPHWENEHLVVIAGGVEEGESPLEAAKRELQEETGFVFEYYTLVDESTWPNGMHCEHYTVIASGKYEKGEQMLDGGEIITPLEVSFKEFIEKTRAREFFNKNSFVDEFLIRNDEIGLMEVFKNPENYSII